MPFENRAEAAHLIAERLLKYQGRNPLVLAIPRGAVPMGRIVADTLGGELDVVLVRKLRAPYNPELAIGSIDETGATYLDPDLRRLWSDNYLAAEREVQLSTLRSRRQQYEVVRPRIDPRGRITVVIDDGVATGSTLVAALRAVRARKPAVLIAAAGVASPQALSLMQAEADEVVCIEVPDNMRAVGYHFSDFSEVSDQDVVSLLEGSG
jgi:predicted phosphoribosyltransferase